MALSPNILANLIKSNLMAAGANGSNLSVFCTAVATGIVMSIIGKPFVTVDTGTIPGAGSGTGVGIIGLSPSIMKSTALGLMSSKGENAPVLMQAITDAVVLHLSAATLISVHAPVFLGTGTITPGTIVVIPSEMGSNIDSQLAAAGAKGVNRTVLAMAIGTGVALNILTSGSGVVAITGTPSGIPIPGSGTGTGVIS